MSQPLQGRLVIALEQAVAAPLCTARLADAGARVIKIERAEGDFARGYDDVVNGESSYFVWLNRGKESICLDIKDAGDQAVLLEMLKHADIFVQNLAPGAAARAGFDSGVLRQANQRLITVDITGYGSEGPYRDMKAYDLLVQCETGLVSVTGGPSEPGRVGVSICDIACGMTAHAAVLEALIERERTGSGKSLQISLFDSVADWMTVPLLHQEHGGQTPPRVGISHPSIAPYGAFSCKDDSQIVIAVQNNREWKTFCESVLRQPKLADSKFFRTNVDRCANRLALDKKIAACFSKLTLEEAREKLRSAGIAFAAVNDLAGLSSHPQLRRCTVDSAAGPVSLVAPAVISQGEQLQLRAIPALDEQGAAIRAEFAPSKHLS
jgi:crotonobetainyl-CoA:carnitine CoA-transferase CaiB-like acyl-CoA transferase